MGIEPEDLVLDIDMAMLAMAWEDPSSSTSYYLDTETGSIIMISPDFDDIDELREEIEFEPQRFLLVPRPLPNQVELDLQDYICRLPDEALKESLNMALESTKKFTACRDILGRHPEQLAGWEQWRRESARTRALRWLEAHGIRRRK